MTHGIATSVVSPCSIAVVAVEWGRDVVAPTVVV